MNEPLKLETLLIEPTVGYDGYEEFREYMNVMQIINNNLQGEKINSENTDSENKSSSEAIRKTIREINEINGNGVELLNANIPSI